MSYYKTIFKNIKNPADQAAALLLITAILEKHKNLKDKEGDSIDDWAMLLGVAMEDGVKRGVKQIREKHKKDLVRIVRSNKKELAKIVKEAKIEAQKKKMKK